MFPDGINRPLPVENQDTTQILTGKSGIRRLAGGAVAEGLDPLVLLHEFFLLSVAVGLPMTENQLSHYGEDGQVRMVDVGDKAPTARRARVSGILRVAQSTIDAIAGGTVPKGQPFEIARIAGITAAKKTSDLIPLCHPLRLSFVDIAITSSPKTSSIAVVSTVAASERTGVEMEAFVACTTALLTIYDMLKAIDHGMVLESIHLIEKSGGKTDWKITPHPDVNDDS